MADAELWKKRAVMQNMFKKPSAATPLQAPPKPHADSDAQH
ncbi:hypothetical protein [Myxococcus xanthus]|nr:hypothetical protein [Myxococcus xanthus]